MRLSGNGAEGRPAVFRDRSPADVEQCASSVQLFHARGSMAAVEPIEHAAAAVDAGASLDDRICQFLVARGRLKETDLARGRRLHEEDPASGSLVSLLTRLVLVSERDMAEDV